MNGFVSLLAILAMLLGVGLLLGLSDRRRFDGRWLLFAAALVAMNDVLLTGAYGMLPDLLPGQRNWQGKLLALVGSLGVLALARIDRHAAGLTLRQAPGSLRAALPVLAAYCGFFLLLALVLPGEGGDAEEIAFQLTMPGLEEELFYRGLLLFALDRAFTGRVRLLGIDWGWGALLSSLLFGLAHAVSYGDGGLSFDALTMALTAVPSLLAVWMRVRTGSLLLPVVAHNFGNSAMTLL